MIKACAGSSLGYAPAIWGDPATGIDFFMGTQYATNETKSLDEIRNTPLSLEGKNGPFTTPLSNVATVRRVNIPGEIARYNISRVNDVYVNVSGRDVGSVAADIEKALAEMPEKIRSSVTLRGPVTDTISCASSLPLMFSWWIHPGTSRMIHQRGLLEDGNSPRIQ
jgi:hypothetical protein